MAHATDLRRTRAPHARRLRRRRGAPGRRHCDVRAATRPRRDAAQRKLEDAPDPTGPEGAVANAERERAVLAALGKRLAAFKIDAQRGAALREYRAVLGHEIAVDELIVTAGTAKDRAAVDDLNEQTGHNRRKRRELADQLVAKGCRPGTRISHMPRGPSRASPSAS